MSSKKILIGITTTETVSHETMQSIYNLIVPADMLDGYTGIGEFAFTDCIGLKSITIPNSVTSIGYAVFYNCSGLTSMTIGDKTYKKQTVTNGKCKAYKAFNADMTCRDFQYKEGETYELDDEPKLCNKGFHACLNLADVFNYYYGKLERI